MSTLEARLVDAVAGLLEVAPAELDPTHDLEAVWGVDSLTYLEIVDAVEAVVGRRIEDDVFEGCRTVRDLARTVDAALTSDRVPDRVPDRRA